MAATYTYGDPRGGFIPLEDLRLCLPAITWLTRWSDLQIRDAVTLQKNRLQGDSFFLYQAKTGTPVYVPLPPHLLQVLKELPPRLRPSPRYVFWSWTGDPTLQYVIYEEELGADSARPALISAM